MSDVQEIRESRYARCRANPKDGTDPECGVKHDSATNIFHLRSRNSSYVFRLNEFKQLEHLHYGHCVPLDEDLSFLSWSNPMVPMDPLWVMPSPNEARMTNQNGVGQSSSVALQSLEESQDRLEHGLLGKNSTLHEFSDRGSGDFRNPSVIVEYSSTGSLISPFQYLSHQIVRGKPPASSFLPMSYVDMEDEATTLIVTLVDSNTGLQCQLIFSVFHQLDVICRRVEIVNHADERVTIRKLMSATLDFHSDQYFLTQFSGGWARERQKISRELYQGITSIQSVRGISSHQHNPFAIIARGCALTETSGDCFGMMLMYSGNFLIEAEINEQGRLRLNAGIHPAPEFSWQLQPGEAFCSPEAILIHSGKGAGLLSRRYHKFIRKNVMPKASRSRSCPILINTWESTYFHVNHDAVIEIGKSAKDTGVEMVVIDDGWFGERNDSEAGLGDWYPNPEKFPRGLDGVAKELADLGLKMGIWIEPESVNVRSKLFQQHPDWCIQSPGPIHTSSNIRNQYLLDFTRDEVVDHMLNTFRTLLRSAPIAYVKMDMNRTMVEAFSPSLGPLRQGEVAHRYCLGWYRFLSLITSEFPDVIFEGCAGGGGRFDAGMLRYVQQIWTSDNTDASSRVGIQFSTMFGYPVSSIGSHVSDTPNHQTHRISDLKTRSMIAFFGTFGFENDPRKLSTREMEEMRRFTALFKDLRDIIHDGDLYRLSDPFLLPTGAWMFVSPDRKRAIVIAVAVRHAVGLGSPLLRLQGLAKDARYLVRELCPGGYRTDRFTGQLKYESGGVLPKPLICRGVTLMVSGIPTLPSHDMDTLMFLLSMVG